jgi:hypothetical protein
MFFIQGTKGWRGIVPLHSNRANVERLFGPSDDSCKCIYKTETEVVYVEYASEPCKGNPAGWNVPSDTVLSFTVRSKTQQRISDLDFDESKFVKTYDDTMTTYYGSRDEGLKYAVSVAGIINSISYIPSIKDAGLRCSGFPADDGSAVQYSPIVKYSDISSSDENARLDSFALRLRDDLKWKGYIIVYAGRLARSGEARARAERVKNYLVNVRGIEGKRVLVFDGGYREELTVELYLVYSDMPAPVPTPTLAPSEVQKIKESSTKSINPRSSRSSRKQRRFYFAN